MTLLIRLLTGSLRAPRQLVEQNSETRLRDIGGVPKSLRRDNNNRANLFYYLT
jgi:hypothetical protein